MSETAVDIRFYHLTKSALEQSLPPMLEKTIERGKRATLVVGSQERLKSLNTLLWTYNDRGFLPHGSKAEGEPEHQPIWLTTEFENLNQSTYVFFTDGSMPPDPEDLAAYDVCAFMFNGLDANTVVAAREVWKTYKDAGLSLTYWQQGDKGWKQGATANQKQDTQ